MSEPREHQIEVAGAHMGRSIADFQRACKVHIAEEQRKPNPDTALIAVLCDAVRCSRELSRAALAGIGIESERPGFNCRECGHTHQGERFAYICIGCPCEVRPTRRPQRYDLITNYRAGGCVDEMERADDGEWIRFEDVEPTLAAHAADTARLAALERENRKMREALERIQTDDWGLHGGRAVKGNERIACPDTARFYRGYNAGIDTQFQRTSEIARKALAAPAVSSPETYPTWVKWKCQRCGQFYAGHRKPKVCDDPSAPGAGGFVCGGQIVAVSSPEEGQEG